MNGYYITHFTMKQPRNFMVIRITLNNELIFFSSCVSIDISVEIIQALNPFKQWILLPKFLWENLYFWKWIRSLKSEIWKFIIFYNICHQNFKKERTMKYRNDEIYFSYFEVDFEVLLLNTIWMETKTWLEIINRFQKFCEIFMIG